jgi:hypothetical protein
MLYLGKCTFSKAALANAVWSSDLAVNGSYVDGKLINADTSPIIVKMNIDYDSNKLDIKYGNDISISDGNNFNNLRGKTVSDYKTAIITELKSKPFYIYSSVWNSLSLDWWACQSNGLPAPQNFANFPSDEGQAIITIKTLVTADD